MHLLFAFFNPPEPDIRLCNVLQSQNKYCQGEEKTSRTLYNWNTCMYESFFRMFWLMAYMDISLAILTYKILKRTGTLQNDEEKKYEQAKM